MRTIHDERGNAIVEFVWLGVLLLVPLVWLVLGVFEVQRGAFATTSAARSAGQAFIGASDETQGRHRAQAAAERALADQGLTGVPVSVTIVCSLGRGHCLEGTSVVTVRVATEVRLPWTPNLFGAGRPALHLDASHTVAVGRYLEQRS